MIRLKLQYLFAFAIIGSLMPFIPVYLNDMRFTEAQTGYLLGLSSMAVFVTPWIVAALADSGLDARRLMAGIYAVAAAMLLTQFALDTYWPILSVYLLFSLAFAPVIPLQDGMNFSLQTHHKQHDLPTASYHRVRVWGSIGFIVPSLLLYFLFFAEVSSTIILLLGAGFCLAGLINALVMPAACGSAKSRAKLAVEPADESAGAPRRGPRRWRDLPTLAAARAMLRPRTLAFCVGMLLVQISVSAYYGYYPVYLQEHVGVPRPWIGLIVNLGVVVEVFFILGFGRLERLLGLRWVIVLGAAGVMVRMLLLGRMPEMSVAILTQALHGPMVLVMHIAPPIYLNRCAADHYRTSIQGLFAVAILGVGRAVGYALAGEIAVVYDRGVFLYAAGLAGAAALLFLLAFRDHHDAEGDTAAADEIDAGKKKPTL